MKAEHEAWLASQLDLVDKQQGEIERLQHALAEARRLLKKARSAVIHERPHALVVSEIDTFLAATAADDHDIGDEQDDLSGPEAQRRGI